LFLSLFARAFVAAANRSTAKGASFHEMGLNGDYRHCKNSKDVSLLYTDKILDYNRITPVMTIDVDESKATLRFTAELFYLPRDAYYIVSVGTRCHSRPPIDRDSGIDSARERPAVWGHAPNALYRSALDSQAQFGAYYVTKDTGWSVEPEGCSHVRYTAEFGADELVERCGVDLVSEANGDVRVLASLFNVQLVELDATVRGVDWPSPFSVYVDVYNSLVLLQQVPTSPESPLVSVFSRQVLVDPRNVLSLWLRTSQQPQNAATLELDEIFAHEHDPSFELDIAEEAKPHSSSDGIVYQDWRLSSHEPSALFDGDFTLHFCSSRSNACESGHYDHAVRVLVRIANGAATEHYTDAKQLHSEITQHFDLQEEQKLFEGVYDSNDRACMQTYVVGPRELTDKLRVQLLEARLCVDQNDKPLEELVCHSARHSSLLYSGQTASARSDWNVTVHQPGFYGPMSVAVCFTPSTLFRDDHDVSLLRTEQRYETQVRITAAPFRTPAHRFEVDREFYDTLLRLANSDQLGIGATLSNSSMQRSAFSRHWLHGSPVGQHADKRVVESRAHVFSVAPEEKYLHNINQADAATGLGLIFVVLVCFICVVVALCFLRPRVAPASVERGRRGGAKGGYYI